MEYVDRIEAQPFRRLRIVRQFSDGLRVSALVTQEMWNNRMMRKAYMAERFASLVAMAREAD